MNAGAQVALIGELLERRQAIVELIDTRVLNVRGGSGHPRQILDSCFFEAPGLPRDLARLKGALADAHLADGFVPTTLDGSAQALDPVELVALAQRHWERHRWPGRNVRLPYAERLFDVFVLRLLEHLSLRTWDEGDDGAADRLDAIQALLDRLNAGRGAAPLVRDARWLIQTAQGPLTRRLDPYFTIAGHVAASFTDRFRLGIHAAGAKLAGGHLRSQLRHRAAETARPIDDPAVLATTRNSNAMDGALLIGDLVPLLEAYGAASGSDRLDLADAIFQGVSADPELLLTRLDLLGPCTTIEDLFIDRGVDGTPRYTALGETRRHLVERYAALAGRHAARLLEDAPLLDPHERTYSPLGLTYGFCADLLSSMALDTLLAQPSHDLSLEDLFAAGGHLDGKAARAGGWTRLRERGVAAHAVDYSGAWAEQMFDRTVRALGARAAHGDRANASDLRDARIFVGAAPDGTLVAQEHVVTSDLQLALASGATAFPKGQIVADRNEARFLASAEANGKWFGISKVVLTVCTSAGKDALVTGVPPGVVEVLRLTCPGLVVTAPG
jgi:hypothetical protein